MTGSDRTRLRHRLVTSLLDPVRYPAHDLAVAYHERWEVEITIDEADTHQRQACALSVRAHPWACCRNSMASYWPLPHSATMHEAAILAEVAPDRLSFVHSVRILRSAAFRLRSWHPSKAQTGINSYCTTSIYICFL